MQALPIPPDVPLISVPKAPSLQVLLVYWVFRATVQRR